LRQLQNSFNSKSLQLNRQFASNNPQSIVLTNIKKEPNESVENINAVITEVLNDDMTVKQEANKDNNDKDCEDITDEDIAFLYEVIQIDDIDEDLELIKPLTSTKKSKHKAKDTKPKNNERIKIEKSN
jgi:hypothetical protein